MSSEPAEPIAADVRPGKDGKTNALLKIIAGMLGVGLDALKQREQARRHRRMMWVAAAAVVGMTITSVLATTAWFARLEADAQRIRAEAEAETARQTTNFMVDLFKISDPSESLGNTITAREILDKGAERVERELVDQPQIQATLMDTMGSVYTGLGLYSSAASLIERALQTRTTTLGAEHIEVASSLNNLGEVLMFKADYDAAAQRLRDALEIRRRQLGEPHPLVAKTLADLADVLTLQGKHAEAKPLIDEALAMRRQLYGDVAHADVAESLRGPRLQSLLPRRLSASLGEHARRARHASRRAPCGASGSCAGNKQPGAHAVRDRRLHGGSGAVRGIARDAAYSARAGAQGSRNGAA